MMCGEFKGGIGTSSRLVKTPAGTFTVGVLVQANYGERSDLRIAGIPVGQELTDLMPQRGHPPDVQPPTPEKDASGRRKDGSILIVLGTDAPLLPHQLQRVLRRTGLGLGRMGSVAYNSSGDLFVGFGLPEPAVGSDGIEPWRALNNDALDPLFLGAVHATEEAIANALVAAETMVGVDGNTVYALPHDRLRALLGKYHRSAAPAR
jgi:D-aminopeptidase